MNTLLIILFLLCSCSANEHLTIDNVAEVEGLKTGMVTGTTHIDYVAEDFPKAEQLVFDSMADLLHALKTRKIDAAAVDAFIWKAMQNEHDDLCIAVDNWHDEPFGMIFNKADEGLLKQYNSFLADLEASGELQQIKDKWFNDMEGAQMPDLSGIPRSGEPLTVGCTGTMAFFDFIKDGRNYGLDIEIVERFAAWLGRPIEFSMMNFGGLVAATSSGVVDIATSSICITAERAKQVNFSDTYCSGYSIILIRKENSPQKEGYMTLDDIGKATVATLLGSTQDLWMQEHYPDIKPLVFNNLVDVTNALINHQCDAMIVDENCAATILESNPQLAALADGFCPVDFSVCFRHGSDLLPQFNRFQNELRQSGELDGLLDKWTDSTRRAEHLPVVFEQFAGAPLRLGTTLIQEPYSYIIDGKPAGFDVELIARFAKSIGRSVEVIPFDFGGLIPSLSTGKIDIVANSVMYTPERGEKVAFAEPYSTMDSYAIVHAGDLSTEHPAYKQAKEDKDSFRSRLAARFHDNLIKEKRWKLIVDGLYSTVLISILSILLGTLIGVGVCAMRMSRSALCRGFAKGYVGIVRGIPILVLLMILFYVVFARLGVSALSVAVITFALNFAAYTSEMFRTGLESIDPGQKRAGIAMGFTPFQTFRFIILPQTVKRVLPVFKGEAISLVKTTSVVGYIAVTDLTKASDIIRSRTFDAFFPLIIITVIYFVLAWLLGKGLDMIGTSSDKN